MEKSERREVVRLPLTSRALCRIQTEREGEHQGSAAYGGPVRDLSISGIFVETTQRPAVNRTCVVSITLKGEYSSLELKDIKARVTRRDDNGFVVTFQHKLEWFALIPIYFAQTPW